MTKVLRLTITTIGLLVLLLLTAGGADAQSLSSRGVWSFTGSMHVARQGHTATRLKNGKVLVAGGAGTSAELYDPTTGTWSLTGSLNVARDNFKATPLQNGTVLIEGGTDSTGMTLASAELYDPTTGTWSLTGSLNVARESHSAVLLTNGKVLIAGGGHGPRDENPDYTLASAELYDPTTGTWSLTGNLNTGRFDFPMVLLPNGKALIAGGDDGFGDCCLNSQVQKTGLASTLPFSPCFCPHSIGAAELYDPTTGRWSSTGRMNNARVFHTLTPLPNNKVLAAGGERCLNIYVGNCKTLASAEVYDLSAGTWTRTADLHSPRLGHTATRLTSTVLIAGGGLVSSELYDPTTGTWSLTGSMNEARSGNTATRLASGQVLVAGPDASAELYTP